MTTRTPVYYDSGLQCHQPMGSSDTIPVASIPLSAYAGNMVQLKSDGIYVGADTGLVLYVDGTSGVDTNAGTKSAPLKTLVGALTKLQNDFPGSSYQGSLVTIALHAGQQFPHPPTSNFSIPVSTSLRVTFWGDTKYGDFNSAFVAGTTDPCLMSDLARPQIIPSYGQTGGLYTLGGFDLNGGAVALWGVTVVLPAAPPTPLITSYSFNCDYVRAQYGRGASVVSLKGSIVNMSDPTAYWGAIGVHARTELTVEQFGSQFQIQGQQVVPSSSTSSVVTTARQWMMKFLPDYAGNNQVIGPLSATSQTASEGSGLMKLLWSDTEALVVTGTTTNLATFPISYSSGVGLINYLYGVNKNATGQYLNLQSTRLI